MEHTVDSLRQCRQAQQCNRSHNPGAASAQQAPVAKARLHPILQLQRKAGNQAVLALLRSGSVQTSLAPDPDDLKEPEAGQSTDRPMRKQIVRGATSPCMCTPAAASGSHAGTNGPLALFVQAHRAPKRESGQHLKAHELAYVKPDHPQVVHRYPLQPSNQATAEPNVTWGTPSVAVGGGLPTPVAELMERHFSTSFADVSIHADDSGARAAAERGAAAFTKGSDIYFGYGRFQPSTDRGRHLIAHELAHVVQQRNGRNRGGGSEPASMETSRLEQEADQAAAGLPSSFAGIAKARVTNTASFGSEQMSLLGDVVDLKAAIGGGIQSAARWVRAHAGDDPLVTELGQLLDEVSTMKLIRLPRPVIEQMEKMLEWARSVAPSWLPIPKIDFRGDGSQGVAVVDDVAVLAVMLFLAFLLVFVWLLFRLNPETRKASDEAVEEMLRKIRRGLKRDPEPEEKPEPENKPKPDGPPPIPPCPFPTGLSLADPIPIAWHKISSLYPSPIRLAGEDYDRDHPTSLPNGEPIGVLERFWPRFGKVVQLVPDPRGSAAADFRAVLQSYGFNWEGRRYLQADHVQDVQWGATDGENLDVFSNLWPYDAAANASAGTTQNKNQPVTFCESVSGPANINVPIQSVKRPGGYGRYFEITRIGLP